MTYSVDFQNSYVDLFGYMRNYIWDFDVIELLADVEVATFDAFIDMEKLSKCFSKLYPSIISVADECKDEELRSAADAFKKQIEDSLQDDTPAVLDIARVQETAIDEGGKEIIPQ